MGSWAVRNRPDVCSWPITFWCGWPLSAYIDHLRDINPIPSHAITRLHICMRSFRQACNLGVPVKNWSAGVSLT